MDRIVANVRKLSHTEAYRSLLAAKPRHTKVLRAEDLSGFYTEDELKTVQGEAKANYVPLTDLRNSESFKNRLEVLKEKYRQHRWSEEEVQFLKANYMHISDNTIGLALNLPQSVVKNKRNALGLKKGHRVGDDEALVVVWCKRDDYETACLEQNLTKARPEEEFE